MASQLLVHAHRTVGRCLAVVLAGSLVAAGCSSSIGSDGAQQATTASTPSTTLETTVVTPTTTVVETTAAIDSSTPSSELACEPITDGRDTVEIVASWEPGVVRNLEITRARDEASEAVDYVVTPIRVEKLEDADEQRRFLWVQGAPKVFSNGVRVPADRLGPDAAILVGLEVRYSIDDESGLPVDDNINELRYLMEDVQLYHSLDSGRFSEGEVFEVADELPNMNGGENFPATRTVTVASFADEDGCVLLEAVTRSDSEELQRILRAEVPGSAEEGGGTRDFDVAQMEIEKRVVVQFDAMRGFVRSVVATKEITLDQRYSLERTTVVDVTE